MNLQISFLLGLIILSTLGAGLLINQKRNSILKKFNPYIIPISTGIFLGIVFLEFIPRIYEQSSHSSSILILLGVGIVVFAEKYIAPLLNVGSQQKCHAHHTHGPLKNNEHDLRSAKYEAQNKEQTSFSYNAACSSIGCIIVCAFFDGIAIPAAVQLQTSTGFLIGAGMILHIIPEGALVASISLAGGFSRKATLRNLLLVCTALLLGGVLSAMTFNTVGLQQFALPIASGILIYTAIGHLLPIALKSKFGLFGTLIGTLIIFAFH